MDIFIVEDDKYHVQAVFLSESSAKKYANEHGYMYYIIWAEA